MSRYDEELRISTMFLCICLAALIALVLLLGCSDRAVNDDIKGAWGGYNTLQEAQDFAHKHDLVMLYVDNKNHSMGDFFSENSLTFWDPNGFDLIQKGSLVAARAADGVILMHRVKAGDGRGGWVMQGTYNKMPDGYAVRRGNYVGTYVGQFVSNGGQ